MRRKRFQAPFARQRFKVFFRRVWGTEPQTLRDFRTRRWHTCLADVIPDEIKHLLLPAVNAFIPPLGVYTVML